MNDTIDGSWAATFFLVTIAVAVLYVALLSARQVWKEKSLIRKHNREIRDYYDTKTAQIESLHLTYRMMIGGSSLWANRHHAQITNLENWVNQEAGLLDAVGNLERILPVQDELILALESATTRGRGGFAPAEFRNMVEAHR